MSRPGQKHAYHKYLYLSRSERKRIRWVSIQEYRRKRRMYRRMIGRWKTTMVTYESIKLEKKDFDLVEQKLIDLGKEGGKAKVVFFQGLLKDSNP